MPRVATLLLLGACSPDRLIFGDREIAVDAAAIGGCSGFTLWVGGDGLEVGELHVLPPFPTERSVPASDLEMFGSFAVGDLGIDGPITDASGELVCRPDRSRAPDVTIRLDVTGMLGDTPFELRVSSDVHCAHC